MLVFPLLFYVSSMRVYVWVYMCATVCALAFGGPTLMSGIFLDHSSTLYFESGSLHQAPSLLVQLVWIESLLTWGIPIFIF